MVILAKEHLKLILEKHNKWVSYLADGERAIFKDIDFSHTNFSRAILSHAIFVDCDLSECNFESAILRQVTMIDSSLISANLVRADLAGAQLTGCNLTNANFSYSDLRGVNFFRSTLSDARFNCADTNPDTLFYHLVCPETGSYIGYKKCEDNKIVKLLIPEDALRSSATTRKCRASKAVVLAIEDWDGTPLEGPAYSYYRAGFAYRVGDTIEIKDFDTNRWNECSTGIHHFITRTEAIGY